MKDGDSYDIEAARAAMLTAEVRLIHGGCNVPNYDPGISVYFPGDRFWDLANALGLPRALNSKTARIDVRESSAESPHGTGRS